MKRNHFYLYLLWASLLLASPPLTAQAQENLTIIVTGIRGPEGQIAIMAFDSQQGFDKEQPAARFKFPKGELAGDSLTVRLELAPGTYGLVLLDDENSNEKMDKNMLRIPREGFAFSGFEFSKPKKPAFDDFKMEVGDGPQIITLKLQYL